MKDTVAVCGLYCESCGIRIATRNDDEKELERLAEMMKTTRQEIRCDGCRSAVLSPHCRKCAFRECAEGKGIANCEDCPSFPCGDLEEFRSKAPHRAELFESARYRKEHGIEAWLEKMEYDYSCASCGELNSPYYGSCRKCGEVPANRLIGRHADSFRK